MPSDSGSRAKRLTVLRSILAEHQISSQWDLVRLLTDAGFAVTQSSVSRDLRDLPVAKIGGVYQLSPERSIQEEVDVAQGVGPILVNFKPAGPNLLVLRSLTGMASRLGLLLDRAGWSEIVGTVAGDDTVFVASNSTRDQKKIVSRLNEIIGTGVASDE